MSQLPPRPHCSTQLDREWERLRRRPRSIATVRSWARRVDPDVAATLAGIDDLAELIDATQGRAAERGEALLLELVRLARDDQLAGRIVVQRLLPGLIAASARHRFRTDGDDRLQLAVGALWLAIGNYDHERRSRHVAASLISDAVYNAFRRRTRRRSAAEEPVQPVRFETVAAGGRIDPLVEVAAVLGEARQAGVPVADIELLRRLVCVGSPARVAVEHAVTARTIRNRRDRAVARVRAVVGPDAAA